MQRIPAIAVLLALSFPLFPPAVSSEPVAETKLPACCRRDGSHACAMMRSARKASASLPITGPAFQRVRTACPLYPAGKSLPAAGKAGVQPPAAFVFSLASHRTAPAQQAEARYRWLAISLRPPRGPPLAS